MTSPAERVRVECPGCGLPYERWHRSSINLTLGQEWTEEEIRDATTTRCPTCGLVIELGVLMVEADRGE